MKKNVFGFLSGVLTLAIAATPGVQAITCEDTCTLDGHKKEVKSFNPDSNDKRLVLAQVSGCSNICYGRTYRASGNTGRRQR